MANKGLLRGFGAALQTMGQTGIDYSKQKIASNTRAEEARLADLRARSRMELQNKYATERQKAGWENAAEIRAEDKELKKFEMMQKGDQKDADRAFTLERDRISVEKADTRLQRQLDAPTNKQKIAADLVARGLMTKEQESNFLQGKREGITDAERIEMKRKHRSDLLRQEKLPEEIDAEMKELNKMFAEMDKKNTPFNATTFRNSVEYKTYLKNAKDLPVDGLIAGLESAETVMSSEEFAVYSKDIKKILAAKKNRKAVQEFIKKEKASKEVPISIPKKRKEKKKYGLGMLKDNIRWLKVWDQINRASGLPTSNDLDDSGGYSGTMWDQINRASGIAEPPPIEEEGRKYNILGGVAEIGKLVWDSPLNFMGAAASLYEDDNPEEEHDWKDITRRAQEEMHKKRNAEEGGEEYVLPWVQRKDIRHASASAGFSGIAMAANIAGYATGAAIPIPKAKEILGTITSGAAAYKMDKAMFTQQIIDAYRQDMQETKGEDPTPEQVAQLVEDTKSFRRKHAYWEAIPEAVGNTVQMKGMSALFTATFGKSAGVRMLKTIAGMYGVEISTEAITQTGQHNVEIEAGLSEGEKRKFSSREDMYESLKEVFPSTFVLVSIGAGGSAAAGKAFQIIADPKTTDDAAVINPILHEVNAGRMSYENANVIIQESDLSDEVKQDAAKMVQEIKDLPFEVKFETIQKEFDEGKKTWDESIYALDENKAMSPEERQQGVEYIEGAERDRLGEERGFAAKAKAEFDAMTSKIQGQQTTQKAEAEAFEKELAKQEIELPKGQTKEFNEAVDSLIAEVKEGKKSFGDAIFGVDDLLKKSDIKEPTTETRNAAVEKIWQAEQENKRVYGVANDIVGEFKSGKRTFVDAIRSINQIDGLDPKEAEGFNQKLKQMETVKKETAQKEIAQKKAYPTAEETADLEERDADGKLLFDVPEAQRGKAAERGAKAKGARALPLPEGQMPDGSTFKDVESDVQPVREKSGDKSRKAIPQKGKPAEEFELDDIRSKPKPDRTAKHEEKFPGKAEKLGPVKTILKSKKELAKKSKVKVKTKGETPGGDVIEYEEDAEVVLEDTQKQLDEYQKLLKCLGAG